MAKKTTDKLKRFDKEVKLIAPWLNPSKHKMVKKLKKLVPDELYKMSELSFSPFSSDLGVMVKGKGEKYINNIATFMSEAGLSRKGVDFFREVDSHFPDIEASLKADFSPHGKTKLSFYHHCLIPVHLAGVIMKKINISDVSVKYFIEVLSFLMREEELYVGFGFRPDGSVGLKNFFCSSIGKRKDTLCASIAAVMAKLDLSARHISLFIDLHNFLAAEPQRNVFTSIIFTDKPESMIKIDYESVPVEKILEIYKNLLMPEPEIERLSACSKGLNMDKATYLGIKYIDGKPPSFKYYFTRRYALEDDPLHFAELMKETMWVNKQALRKDTSVLYENTG